jgi:hypothetical protein
MWGKRCKEDLLRTAYVDGMVRASQSQQCQREVADLRKWTQVFFGQWHDKLCLHDFLDAHVRQSLFINLPTLLLYKVTDPYYVFCWPFGNHSQRWVQTNVGLVLTFEHTSLLGPGIVVLLVMLPHLILDW